jgi:formylmethanofuran dehydrogenase subunit E
MSAGGTEFERLLAKAAELRGHLCLGLPLGLKMASKGLRLAGMTDPEARDSLVVFVENNRCAVDAMQVATGCSMGSRRLKVYLYGKSAATFLNVTTGRAVRVFARPELRGMALALAVKEGIITEGDTVEPRSSLERKIIMSSFMKLSEDELFDSEEVKVKGAERYRRREPVPRVSCQDCGEEILDGKGRELAGRTVCVACAGAAYYERT